MSVKASPMVWITAVVAGFVLLTVIVIVVELWGTLADDDISPAGWAAMILGILFTLALGVGLMSLVFFSSRHGYDDGDPRR